MFAICLVLLCISNACDACRRKSLCGSILLSILIFTLNDSQASRSLAVIIIYVACISVCLRMSELLVFKNQPIVYRFVAECHIDSCLGTFERARRNLEGSLKKFSSPNFLFDEISVESCVFSGLEGMSKFCCNLHLQNVTVNAQVSRPTVLF